MKLCWRLALLLGIALLIVPAPSASGQTQTSVGGISPPASSPQSGKTGAQTSVSYTRPTEKTKILIYLFDSFGPYAIVGTVAAAGISQATNKPPDWGQGMSGYGDRVGSKFGINLVATTARYGMAEIFREDTNYYRCECSGFFPRFEHALISTVTARRGNDGHRTISFSKIAAPYAGTETAALGWYPSRFNAMDGFRMGNYLLLAYGGLNIAKEFIYGGPHTLVKNVPLLGRHN